MTGAGHTRVTGALAAGRIFASVVFAIMLCVACGPTTPPPTDPGLLRADAALLTASIGRDPAPQILGEADGMVDDRRPVRAAEIMRTAALPAVRRQLERVAALALRTAEGRALQERAGRAYRRRALAIERYAAALARGEVEDDVLLDAVHAHREAEQDVLSIIEASQALGQPSQPTPSKRRAPAAPAVE